MPSLNTKKELKAFLGIIKYLSKFSPSNAESLRQPTSRKTKWTWNATYEKLFDKAKSIIKEDTCMNIYDKNQQPYLETDTSGVGLGAARLQARNSTNCPRDKALNNSILRCIAFVSKSLISAEKR